MKLAVASIIIAASTSALAQEVPPPRLTPEQTIRKVPNQVPAGVSYLMDRYKVSEQDAKVRIANEIDIATLSGKLRESLTGSFGGIYIEHLPKYRIVVLLKNGQGGDQVVSQAAANLRPAISTLSASRSVSDIESGMDQLLTSLKAVDVAGYTIVYDLQNQKYVVKVENAALKAVVQPLIPALLANTVTLVVEPVPKANAAPVGVRPGDFIHGGFFTYDIQSYADSAKGCTLGYDVRWGSKQGVLSAGHCDRNNTAREYWDWANDHWVKIDQPELVRNEPNTKYDYMFLNTTGYNSGGWIFYDNMNSRPGYPVSGYFNVVSTIGYYDQVKGMVMCKQGRKSGFACGEITNGWLTWNGAKGFIEYGNPDAYSANLSDPGDSGGPTFMSPDTLDNINAYGLHVGGSGNEGCRFYGTCVGVSMPIDYIDDHYPISVILNPRRY